MQALVGAAEKRDAAELLSEPESRRAEPWSDWPGREGTEGMPILFLPEHGRGAAHDHFSAFSPTYCWALSSHGLDTDSLFSEDQLTQQCSRASSGNTWHSRPDGAMRRPS